MKSILRLGFSRLENAYGFVTEVFILLSGVLLWIYDLALKINLLLFGLGEEYMITRGVTFLFLVSLLSTIIRAPFEVYRIFVIDGKFFETKQERRHQQKAENLSRYDFESLHTNNANMFFESEESELMDEGNNLLNSTEEEGDNSPSLRNPIENQLRKEIPSVTFHENQTHEYNSDEDVAVLSDIGSDGSMDGGTQDIMTLFRHWIMDQIKMGVMAVIVGTPLLFLILWLLIKGSPIHWVYMWVGSVALAVGIYELYPVVLAPMFNTFYGKL